MMQQKFKYNKPQIVKIKYVINDNLLVGSIVEKTSVTSCGQEVIEYDFNNSQFNHNWE